MPNPVVHFDIGCRDLERARHFYLNLFDWDDEPYGPLSHRLKNGAKNGIEGFLTSLGHEPQNYVMIYVEVADIPASLARVLNLGGTVLINETGVPNDGSFAWINDPDGNLIGLWNPAGRPSGDVDSCEQN